MPTNTPQILNAWGDLTIASALALALIVVVALVLVLMFRLVRSTTRTQVAQSKLFERTVMQLGEAQQKNTEALQAHTQAIVDLVHAVGTDQVNQLRMASASTMVESTRRFDRMAGALERIDNVLTRLDERVGVLEKRPAA